MQAGDLYKIRFSESQATRRGTRVGLLHERTGVPVFLLFLESIHESQSFQCHSFESLEVFASHLTSKKDKENVLALKIFFEEGAALAQIQASPLDYSGHVLSQMIGQSNAFNKRSGLYLLNSISEHCDLVIVPQARSLLNSEETKIFYEKLINQVSLLNALFALIDVPKNLDVIQAREWSKSLSSVDAALYYPALIYNGKEISSLPAIAAHYQLTDTQKSIAELPTISTFQSAVMPAINLSPSQQMELLNSRINSVVFAPGSNHKVRVWGGHTLARPPDMEFSLIPVRRTLRALRESLESIAEAYVLEPLTTDIAIEIEYKIRGFLDENRTLFDLFSRNPFEVNASKISSKDAEGVDIYCRFRLSRCLQELNLNFGVTQN
jgi:hypothetical protein